jgi:tRNA pseudouridine55 synthase
MTSHDAVAFVRRVLKNKRVGHTGTLDPAAAGVLPICVGQATRLVENLQAGTKEYLAEATFGFETDTLDAVGEVVRECDASNLDLETLRSAMNAFRGEITQTPPLHSAIKVDGQKLYDLARAGRTIEIPTRRVTISKLLVEKWLPANVRAP